MTDSHVISAKGQPDPAPVSLALFQPDIPQNTGTLLRLGACLRVPVHVIEPAGFDLSDRAMRRAGLDYLDQAVLVRHTSWNRFTEWLKAGEHRLVLLTTRAETGYCAFRFQPGDILLLGRESAGVPETVHKVADHTLRIPIAQETRSLNVALAGAMVIGEALRQTGGFG